MIYYQTSKVRAAYDFDKIQAVHELVTFLPLSHNCPSFHRFTLNFSILSLTLSTLISSASLHWMNLASSFLFRVSHVAVAIIFDFIDAVSGALK